MAKKTKKRTNHTMFKEVVGQLIALGLVFPCLESFTKAPEEVPLPTLDYICVGEMHRGTNEGVIVRLTLAGAEEVPLGTLRAMSDSRNTWMYMSMMMADALWICEGLLGDTSKGGVS